MDKSEDMRRYVSDLSKIGLHENEEEELIQDLNDIIQFMSALKKIDIEANTQKNDKTNVFREDIVRDSISVNKIIKNAQDSQNGTFVVPQIIT